MQYNMEFLPTGMWKLEKDDVYCNDKNIMISRMNIDEAIDFYVKGQNLISKIKRNINKKEMEKLYEKGKDSWRGGSYDDLVNRIVDYDAYEKVYDNIRKDKNIVDFANKLNHVKRRRRTSDSREGEYDIDKRWDTNPFNLAVRKHTQFPCLEIVATMSFSCNISAQSIAEHGAKIIAICKILEANGLNVKITLAFASSGVGRETNGKHVKYVMIKDYCEYVSLQSLLTAFSPNFWRRAMFATLILGREAVNENVYGGLGRPMNNYSKVEMIGNKLVVYSEPGRLQSEDVIDNLTKLLFKKAA